MDDKQIIELYWERTEAAISETANKYGRYCYYIANNILQSNQDSEECVNDTYMRAWESIPPQRPSVLKVYLGTITRNLALDKYAQQSAEKLNPGRLPIVLDELNECLPTLDCTENVVDDIVLADVFNQFLSSLTVEQRKIFMRRYWYFSTVKEIATDYRIGESKVKMTLLRARNKLKRLLEKEGIVL